MEVKLNIIYYFCGGVRLSPLGTLSATGPTLPVPSDNDRLGHWWNDRGKREVIWENHALVTLYPPQILYRLSWNSTWPYSVRIFCIAGQTGDLLGTRIKCFKVPYILNLSTRWGKGASYLLLATTFLGEQAQNCNSLWYFPLLLCVEKSVIPYQGHRKKLHRWQEWYR